MSRSDEFGALGAKIKKGGAPKYHDANAAAGKLFCRERIALLCDPTATARGSSRTASTPTRPRPICPPTAW